LHTHSKLFLGKASQTTLEFTEYPASKKMLKQFLALRCELDLDTAAILEVLLAVS
jgi:hypothetical protein